MALAQPKEIADAVARYRANVSRQRLDFRQTPGLMHAVLTVALPNGQTMRFVGTVSMDAMRDAYVRANPSVGKDLADSFKENFMGTHTGAALKTKFLETAHKLWSQNAVLPNTRAMGARGNKPVRDSFSSFNAFWSWYIHLPIKETTHMGSLKHAWKSIKKMAKTVATSKVFQAAAIGLAIVAPMLGGPLAAAAVAAGGAMTVARKLYAAKQHLAKGNVSAARALIASAKKDADSPSVRGAVHAHAADSITKKAPAMLHAAEHMAKKADKKVGPAAQAYGKQQAKKKVYALLLQPAA